MKSQDLELFLITGMSGSGKSVALRALEDAGYFCVDNLPPELLASFIQVEKKHGVKKIALAVDARTGSSLAQLPQALEQLQSDGVRVKCLFLDAGTEILVHRFSETRRSHPLSSSSEPDQRQALTDAIETERGLLAALREKSHVIDTGLFRSSQLQSYIKQMSANSSQQLMLVFESFGFKRGVPLDADYIFDVRMLPNPHYEAQLRPLTGRDTPVADFLKSHDDVRAMFRHIHDFLQHWLPHLARDNRSYVTVAIGCTGGQHRSVFLVEELAHTFSKDYATLRRHREIDGNVFASSVF